MKSITIHKIDDELEQRLSEIASKKGQSLNQLIKNLLRERLGLDEETVDNRSDFEEFCGRWTEKETKEFNDSVSTFSEIDEEMWK